MKTKFLSENAVMIGGSTWVITEPVLDNIGTDGEVAFYATARHSDENGGKTEIRIFWPSETGEWDDLDEDDFRVFESDLWGINQVLNPDPDAGETGIISASKADFCEDGTTVEVTAQAGGIEQIFYVRTTDGRYRGELGCWITTPENGDDIDPDDYPDFNLSDVIEAAEKELSSQTEITQTPYSNALGIIYQVVTLCDDEVESVRLCHQNPLYINSAQSSYQREWIDWVAVTPEGFRAFVLSGDRLNSEIAAYLDGLAALLGVDDEQLDQIYDLELGSIAGTLYCPSDFLCERFGLASEADMKADIEQIAEEAGLPFQVVNDALHAAAEVPDGCETNGFYDGLTVFVDLEALKSKLKKPDQTTYNPDPEYLRNLVTRSGLSQAEIARRLGVTARQMCNYLMEPDAKSYSKAPYLVQFALERLVSKY